jgi:LmbE family N-acetylglucosaminyl deacetylase
VLEQLPAWSVVLAVVAHPDDESFGLGGVIHQLTSHGTAVHVLCFTHGEASTIKEISSDLRRVRESELRLASAELGVTSVTLLDFADGQLAEAGDAALADQAIGLAARLKPDGLLVFDETGITGHPDHQAATRAAILAAAALGRSVLGWSLPAAVAEQLRSETGQPFAGQQPDRLDLCVPVDRERQRHVALMHASQAAPGSALWRRLDLLGDREYLRWL